MWLCRWHGVEGYGEFIKDPGILRVEFPIPRATQIERLIEFPIPPRKSNIKTKFGLDKVRTLHSKSMVKNQVPYQNIPQVECMPWQKWGWHQWYVSMFEHHQFDHYEILFCWQFQHCLYIYLILHMLLNAFQKPSVGHLLISQIEWKLCKWYSNKWICRGYETNPKQSSLHFGLLWPR